jgi:hypothetical protein
MNWQKPDLTIDLVSAAYIGGDLEAHGHVSHGQSWRSWSGG